MTDFGNIAHHEQRAVDGSGRLTLGKFKATCNGWTRDFVYDDSATNEHFDTSKEAYGKAIDWISDRLMDQIGPQPNADYAADLGDHLCHQRMEDEMMERDQ